MEKESREKKSREQTLERYLGTAGASNKLILLENSSLGISKIAGLDVVKEEAENIENHSSDIVVPLCNIVSNDGEIVGASNFTVKISGTEANNLTFSSNGLSEYCGMLDIPTAYIRKCLSEGEIKEALDTLTFWNERASGRDKDILVRTTDDRIHGILSSRYSVFDDYQVIDTIENIIPKHGDYEVKNYFIDPENLRLRIVSKERRNICDRELSFGYDIKNSRVGSASLEVNIIIFDHICSNGMIMGGGTGTFYSQRHIGINPLIFQKRFTEIIHQSPAAMESVINALNASGEKVVTSNNIQTYLNRFKAAHLPVAAVDKVMSEFKYAEVENLFGLTSAITKVAQEYCLDTREQMERFAGHLILQNSKIA